MKSDAAGYASPRQSVIAGPPAKVDAVVAEVQGRTASHIGSTSRSPLISHCGSDPSRVARGAGGSDARVPAIPSSPPSPGDKAPRLMPITGWTMCASRCGSARQSPKRRRRHGIFVEVSPHPMLTHAITTPWSVTHHHSIPTLQRGAHDTLTFHTNLNATHTSNPQRPRTHPNPIRRYPPPPGTTAATGPPPPRRLGWEERTLCSA